MLDQKVGGTDFPLGGGPIDAGIGRTVMLGHVDLEFIGVGVLWRFPSGLVGLLIEVVWQVL